MFVGSGSDMCWGRRPLFNVCCGPIFGVDTVLGEPLRRYAKRNLVKLMYIRMLGYPAEFGQVPCLDLITKGDYSAKVRAAVLALNSCYRCNLFTPE